MLGRDVPGAPPESLRAYRPGHFRLAVRRSLNSIAMETDTSQTTLWFFMNRDQDMKILAHQSPAPFCISLCKTSRFALTLRDEGWSGPNDAS